MIVDYKIRLIGKAISEILFTLLYIEDDMTDEELCRSFDALVWAQAFVNHVKSDPAIPTDIGTMHSWFASAIMSGYDEAKRRASNADAMAGPRFSKWSWRQLFLKSKRRRG